MTISALWAKKSKDTPHWLPLWTHMAETGEVAKLLWDKWLPESTKKLIAHSVGGDEQEGRKLFAFLAAAHDFGKATPVFQAKCYIPKTGLDVDIYDALLSCGLLVRETREAYRESRLTPHAIASQLLLENAKKLGLSDADLCLNAAVVLGAHHGKPMETGYRGLLHAYEPNFGLGIDAWKQAQSELILRLLHFSGYNSLADIPSPLMPGQVLLSALVVIADWIASDENRFPLFSFDYTVQTDAKERARIGWESIQLPGAWDPFYSINDESLYSARFGSRFEPNLIQKAVIQAANESLHPGIMIIEAPMGSGKTEAALAAAEIVRHRVGSGGLFFALPTQATSDGIFPRMLAWINKLELPETQSVKLAHGKAQFNEDYTDLLFSNGSDSTYLTGGNGSDPSENASALAFQWFNGRKKTLLANFVVGTIDQLLLMALKTKHVMLRHLGLAGKVVVVDECHAYDAYMNHYLKQALTWLGAYAVPVVVLSATLPTDKRRELVAAYLGKDSATGDWAQSQAYPLITYTNGEEVRSITPGLENAGHSVLLQRLADDRVVDKLEDLLSEGGCAGVILDTVRRAQSMARKLRERFPADIVLLIHSRFITPERMENEKKIRGLLGKDGARPEKLIVVGTQVLEQSLDIDFDVMVVDVAPMDLLLQRLGREHRHMRVRKEKLRQPLCLVTGIKEDGFERGIDRVYDLHLLNRTRDLLDSLPNDTIKLPGDIARLVNACYDKDAPQTPEKEAWEEKRKVKEKEAGNFCMKKPLRKPDKTIVDWLVTDMEDKNGEATVRDSYDAVEVLVVKKNVQGFSMMNGVNLPPGKPDDNLARQLACQSLSLPRELSNRNTIDELRKSTNEHVLAWQSSPWLSGELFLIFDENNSATLCGHKLIYSSIDGLYVERENTEEN